MKLKTPFQRNFDYKVTGSNTKGLNCPKCATYYKYNSLGFNCLRRFGVCGLNKECN